MQRIGCRIWTEGGSAGMELWVKAVEAYEGGVKAFRRGLAARASTGHTRRFGISHLTVLTNERARDSAMFNTAASQLNSGVTAGQCPLTRRESEIAVLIARGLSNRQIAEVLVITPGTTANHVANILGRLGFRSRIEVAAWVIRNDVSCKAQAATAAEANRTERVA